jgi:aminoglycoside phosphotransferase (APT) family kinase protein
VDAQTARILAEIEAKLPGWLPDAEVHGPIALARERQRRSSRIIRLTVGDPPRYRLFVKVTPQAGPAASRGTRPRLVPVAEPRIRATLELRALQAVEERLGPTGTDRFDVLHPLGVVDDGMALAMLTHEGVSLARTLSRVSRGWRSPVSPEILVDAAGAWLRQFHDAPVAAPLPARQERAADLARALGDLGEFLLAERRSRELADLVDRAIAETANLPDPLPLRPIHGDFAPRNLIVGRDGRLTVIDLLGHWRAPLYEDLATFLVALHSGRQIALTGGRLLRRPVAVLERHFLAGYAGDTELPRRPIALYEFLLVLDKWSSRLTRLEGAGTLSRIERRLLDHHFLGRARAAHRNLDA